MMRDDDQRRAEALDLQRPRELPLEARPYPVRRENDERQHDRCDYAGCHP
jgi:hypothetical protein